MNNISRHWKRLFIAGLLGGVGGAINGWLYLARIPVPVHENPSFSWPVVPGGGIHGALLAWIPLTTALCTARWRTGFRLLLAPVVGWFAGYLSWICLNRWVFDESWAGSLAWPWDQGAWCRTLWIPFAHFGLVSALFFPCAGPHQFCRTEGDVHDGRCLRGHARIAVVVDLLRAVVLRPDPWNDLGYPGGMGYPAGQ